MFLVPYRKTHIVSPNSAEVIAERLRLQTSRRWPWFRSPAPQFDFVGKVSPKGFRLIRAIRTRNTYQPWVLGRITARPGPKHLDPAPIIGSASESGMSAMPSPTPIATESDPPTQSPGPTGTTTPTPTASPSPTP